MSEIKYGMMSEQAYEAAKGMDVMLGTLEGSHILVSKDGIHIKSAGGDSLRIVGRVELGGRKPEPGELPPPGEPDYSELLARCEAALADVTAERDQWRARFKAMECAARGL